MRISSRHVRAVFRKELREYRRNRSIVAAMERLPLFFGINPLVEIFLLPASTSHALSHGDFLSYLPGNPAIAPVVLRDC
ncbi:hypothetical protein [Arthrobacter sp. A5]|uniref:hypothetical protein n=1 Tax=Arthrobacter sp. A5 TaxID=576926 RepID=UPI003DA93FED